MKYPEYFKKEVKSAYPYFGPLHKLLEDGSDLVGRYLDDGRQACKFSPQEILTANSLQELKEKAKRMMLKIEVYAEWGELYSQQVNPLEKNK